MKTSKTLHKPDRACIEPAQTSIIMISMIISWIGSHSIGRQMVIHVFGYKVGVEINERTIGFGIRNMKVLHII